MRKGTYKLKIDELKITGKKETKKEREKEIKKE